MTSTVGSDGELTLDPEVIERLGIGPAALIDRYRVLTSSRELVRTHAVSKGACATP